MEFLNYVPVKGSIGEALLNLAFLLVVAVIAIVAMRIGSD